MRPTLEICALFQSTLPMKGVTPADQTQGAALEVSIHTPNEGSDSNNNQYDRKIRVSIHTPNEGSDRKIWQKNKPARQIWAVSHQW